MSQQDGATPSERYLGKLCAKSFLSLWSFQNLYTDEGKKSPAADGKELCDLLVIFGDHLLIFSDKRIKFTDHPDLSVAWKRWYKKAVNSSANQLFGAESWIRKFPDRIFLDKSCQQLFPFEIKIDELKVHRIAVSLGASERCRQHFQGQSIGSLLLRSDLNGLDAHQEPFTVGQPNSAKGFVHVFDDHTLDAVFQELDTVTDFVAYLERRRSLLTRDDLVVIAAGEEQLLANYLTNINAEEEHDFYFGSEGHPDVVYFEEGHWERMVSNAQYLAKKEADRQSYVWDTLIEHISKTADVATDDFGAEVHHLPFLEQGLRFMAAESRVNRRILGAALLEHRNNVPVGGRGARVCYVKQTSKVVYVFLFLGRAGDADYDEYREKRRAMLMAYSEVAKLRCPEADYIVGLGQEPQGSDGFSEDLVVFDAREWTADRDEAARQLQQETGFLLPSNAQFQHRRTDEYPEVMAASFSDVGDSGGHPDQDGNTKSKRKKKKAKRKMARKSRRNNRKK